MKNGSDEPHFEDWRAVHEAVADAYFPHVMKPLTTGSASRSALRSVDLGLSRITHMSLGAEVSVASEHPGGYGINIPLTGQMESLIQRTAVVSSVGQATACPPDTTTMIPHWNPSCRLIGFRIDEDYLHREMARILARPAQRLPLQLELRTDAGQSWLRLLESVFDQVVNDEYLLRNDLVLSQLSGVVTTGFVLAALPDVDSSRSGTRPRIVRKVMSAIDDDPARAWVPGDLAEIAGVSVRRLQQGFREYVGMTPFEYLQDVRLDRAHADLKVSGPPTTVVDIAIRWGLPHTGRFAAAYRRKYGVPPSQTLAQ